MTSMSASVGENVWARDFYAGGVPRGYVPPCHNTLMGPMLDDEYNCVEMATGNLWSSSAGNADFAGTFKCDDYMGPRGGHILVCLHASVKGTYVCCTHACTGESKDADYIYQNATKPALEKVDPNNTIAAVTDNHAAMTTMWDLVTADYPWIVPGPCDGHGGNLMFKDASKDLFISEVWGVNDWLARFVRERDWPNSTVMSMAKDQLGFPYRPIIHGETRQCTTWFTGKRNMLLLGIYQQLVLMPGWAELKLKAAEKTKFETIVKSAKYKSNTEACLEIMKPIKNMTKLHDHNSNTTSKQYPAPRQDSEPARRSYSNPQPPQVRCQGAVGVHEARPPLHLLHRRPGVLGR